MSCAILSSRTATFLERSSEDDNSLQWPDRMMQLFNLKKEYKTKPLTVMTLCSGIEAPIVALVALLQTCNVRHVAACDRSASARAFITENFCPGHIYHNTCDLLFSSQARCDMCDLSACKGFQEEVDLMVAGFPCAPHSSLHSDRWKPSKHSHEPPGFAGIQEHL